MMVMMHQLLIVGLFMVSALLLHPVHTSASVIESCAGRCGDSFKFSADCNCNKACDRFSDCCFDYPKFCGTDRETTSTGSESSVEDISNRNLQSVVTDMWVADSGLRLTPGQDFTLNLQTRVSQSNKQDRSPKRLFQNVASAKLKSDIFQTFDSLLDNYHPRTGFKESTSATEDREVTDFLTAVYATSTFQTMKSYLQSKGLLPQTDYDVDLRMREIWFLPYSRSKGRAIDSSGFEHVFLGEFKRGVTGMHNWYQVYKLEQSGDLNYQGYTNTQQPQLVSAQIVWDGNRKSRASMFVGTTPAFDLSVYTLCFLEQTSKVCEFKLEGSSVEIQTHDLPAQGRGTTVGSAYPLV